MDSIVKSLYEKLYLELIYNDLNSGKEFILHVDPLLKEKYEEDNYICTHTKLILQGYSKKHNNNINDDNNIECNILKRYHPEFLRKTDFLLTILIEEIINDDDEELHNFKLLNDKKIFNEKISFSIIIGDYNIAKEKYLNGDHIICKIVIYLNIKENNDICVIL